MSDPVYVWTVADHTDTATRRQAKLLDKEEAHRWCGLKQTPRRRFLTEQDALQFLVGRAQERVDKAEQEVTKEKRRLAACIQRLKGRVNGV